MKEKLKLFRLSMVTSHDIAYVQLQPGTNLLLLHVLFVNNVFVKSFHNKG